MSCTIFALLCFTAVTAASAQVTLTVNVPPYGFEVLSGAQRTVAAYPAGAGAITQKVNWSVSGGATLSCNSNCIPIVSVTITAAGGTCAVTGSVGNYALTSTSDVILTAQSVDDPTKTATIPFHVCSATPIVDVEPAYNQAYEGQKKTLQSYVLGSTNENVTWSVTTSPAGGDGTLVDTVNRDAVFSATVTGRYTITAKSVANSAVTGSAIVYVSPNAMPSYTATPNKTEPTECYADPALSGKVYDVGPSQPNHDLTSVSMQTWPAGSIVRVHNEDTSGTNPTTYFNTANIEGNGTPTQPIILCGVADSHGNLPILDANNATQNPNDDSSIAGLGVLRIIYTAGSSGFGQGYALGSVGPDYLSVTGLELRNGGNSGIYVRSGQHMHFEGMDLETVGWGILDNNNTGASGRAFTQFHQFIGGHINNFSHANSASQHALYLEAMHTLVEGSLLENPVAGDGGDYIKVRGGDSIIRYNTFHGSLANHVLEYPDMEDTFQFVSLDQNLGVPGDTNCGDSTWCTITSNNITLAQLAENSEALAKDFAYGNVMANESMAAAAVQYGSFSAPLECPPCTEMDDRQGRLSFFSNTVDQQNTIFQTANPYSSGYSAQPQYTFLTIFAANNALWSDGVHPFQINLDATMVATLQTNLFGSGVMNLATPIAGGSGGWGSYSNAYSFPLATPLNGHINGLTPSNFLSSAAMPYSPATYAPISGSPLVGAGTAITDPAISSMPVRFQPNAEKGYMTARSTYTTIGAVESGAAPKITSITVLPGTMTVAIGAIQYYSATCNYSDGTSADCTAQAVWSSTNSSAMIFWSSTANHGNAYVAGSGYVQATVGGVSGTSAFAVGLATPPPILAPTGPELNTSIAVAQPEFGFNVLPGSVRRVFATVTNGSTNGVTWTVKSGSATLSSTQGSWVDITAPAVGSSCSFTLGNNAWTVSSATQFVVEATSTDDPTKVADLTFSVCSPKAQLAVVPFYRTLYAKQPADVQSMIQGSTNQNVHWAITSQPTGGDGTLADSTLRDTVFSATIPGRYVLTATSQADPTVSSTAIMYVTGNPLPTYKVTPNLTQPVDCTVDPAMLGTIYEVGPSQSFKTLASVPFPSMPAGSTVRLHNEDTTGLNPTAYHEYVQISQTGAMQDQPIRVCGVPDKLGNLPVMDAGNAVGRSDTNSATNGYGLITVGSSTGASSYPNYSGPSYVSIEGIKFQNAQAGYSFTAPNGSPGSWTGSSAGIRIFQAHHVVVVGNDIANNGNGVYSDFNAVSGWGGSVLNVLWEGNHLHGNGSTSSHQMNLQAWNEIVQLNRIENYPTNGNGANVKSRSLGTVIRYNYLGDGAARQMDLAEVQDSTPYMTFSGYLDGYPSSFHDLNSADQYTADLLAAAQEQWNSHFVYGNIYQNLTSTVPIHFGYDTAGGEAARKGNLFWYNNTFNEELCPICIGETWSLFDTQGANGTTVSQVEYPTVQIYNNVIWAASPILPIFSWNSSASFIGVAGLNLVPASWGTGDLTGGSGTGYSIADSSTAYQGATSLVQHLIGFTTTNLLAANSIPFDATTSILNASTPASEVVPSAVCEMPVRFSYLPTLGYAVPRITSLNVGATDTVPEIAAEMTSIGGSRHYNTRNSNCR